MILVCGGLADTVTELVCARLEDCKYPYRLLDLGTYPRGFEVNWRWTSGCAAGSVAGPDWTVDLASLTGVYVRYLGADGRVQPPDVAEHSVPAVYAEYDAGLTLLFEDLPCTIVNRVAGGMSNHSKPYQALLVRASGLDTPPTLVTNDPEAARRFYDEHHGEVIYKSLSGVRSIVRKLGADQLARLPFLKYGPAQFQAFIPGDNVRVHTVGGDLFVTRVRSTAVDYRYARAEGADVEMSADTLPPAIAEACLTVARDMDLVLSGIDLKCTPDGQYYCFEVNPSPGFVYYERYTKQPISLALADVLHRGCRREE